MSRRLRRIVPQRRRLFVGSEGSSATRRSCGGMSQTMAGTSGFAAGASESSTISARLAFALAPHPKPKVARHPPVGSKADRKPSTGSESRAAKVDTDSSEAEIRVGDDQFS